MILRDARLHLAHQIGAHISRFGVDAATHTRKESDGGRAKTEARKHADGFSNLPALAAVKNVEQ